MKQLFIICAILVNVGLAGAVSSAIGTPVERLQAAVAAPLPETMQLVVSVHGEDGSLIAQPTIVSRVGVESTVRTAPGPHRFSLTATFEEPRDPGSYNPPSRCHIVNLRLVGGHAEPAQETDQASIDLKSMMKLCGEPITLPINETDTITVKLDTVQQLAQR